MRGFLDRVLGHYRPDPSSKPSPIDEGRRGVIAGLQFELDRERRQTRDAIAKVQMRIAEGALQIVRGHDE